MKTSSSHPRTCLFSFSTQFENLGDCVINELLLKEVGRYQNLVILGHCLPEWLKKTLEDSGDVMICRSRVIFLQRLLQQLMSGDRTSLLFKPGHMVRRFSLFGQARVLAVALTATMLAGFGCRVFRVGTSLDAYGEVERLAQAELGRTHALYGVRDEDSLKAAMRLGITNAALTPDLAFLLPFHAGTHSRNEVGLSFRKRSWLDQDQGAEIGKAIRTLRTDRKLEPVVVQQVQFDEDVSTILSAGLNAPVVRFEGTQASCEAIFARYEDCELVVSNRLHSLLFAWSRGAIPVAVTEAGEDSKIHRLFSQYSLQGLVIDVNSTPSIGTRLHQILETADTYRGQLREIFEQEGNTLREILRSECSESGLAETERPLSGSHK